jgi:hypothetical protein
LLALSALAACFVLNLQFLHYHTTCQSTKERRFLQLVYMASATEGDGQSVGLNRQPDVQMARKINLNLDLGLIFYDRVVKRVLNCESF